MTSYWDFPGFENLYLEDSWVTAVRATPGRVEFDVEFVLREHHPAYSQPKRGEKYCYHSGTIRIVSVSELRWDGQGGPAALDATGDRDYGAINSFERQDGVLRLTGDFGRVEARSAAAPEVVLDGSVPSP